MMKPMLKIINAIEMGLQLAGHPHWVISHSMKEMETDAVLPGDPTVSSTASFFDLEGSKKKGG